MLSEMRVRLGSLHRVAGGEATPSALGAVALPAQPGAAQNAASVRIASPSPAFELPQPWPASSTQVCVQAGRVHVVMRDAELAKSEWPALRERLRSRCEACGLELAELMINGVPVPEPAAGQPGDR